MKVFTNTLDAYRAQGERLMSNLPESIKTLKVNTTIFDNVMEALDQANINPIRLEFKESREASPSVFKTSNQLGYLKKLAALRTLEVTVKSSMQKYNQDLASTFITKLVVGFAGAKSFQTIDLGWLLSLFPSLEILNIKHSDAKVKGGSDIEKTYPKLRRLSISKSPTHRNLLGYIEKVAPRLTELRWTVVGKLEYEHPRKLNPIKDVHTLDLSGYQNLETFDLTLSSKTFKKVFLFNCSISLQKENHSLICTNFGRIKELDDTDCLDHMTAVNIICGNIRALKLQNTLIANQHGFVPLIA
jgi:hypothetical protein